MTLITTATELPRLMRCIGSRLMPAALPPDYDTEARDEGNAADWLAEQIFNGNTVPLGSKAPNGWVITDDMMEHVRTYIDALDCGDMQVVTTFRGDEYEVRGRADHIKYRDGRLTIDDLKYGHRIVSPIENWTLMAHAIGWCMKNKTQPDRIVLRIIQPRPYHPDGPVREWNIPYSQLCGYYERIHERLRQPTDELTSGIDQCAKCHALATCPAARKSSYNAIDATDLAFSDDLPNEVLAFEKETLDTAEGIIKARRDALDELMTYRIKSGQVIHGYGLESRLGQRRWTSGLTGAMLSAAAGTDLTKDSIVTPAEAERRGVSKAAIAALTERPTLPAKLQKIDVDAKARRAFG